MFTSISIPAPGEMSAFGNGVKGVAFGDGSRFLRSLSGVGTSTFFLI
jgi:hypothetical protein